MQIIKKSERVTVKNIIGLTQKPKNKRPVTYLPVENITPEIETNLAPNKRPVDFQAQ
jgi:hypothetical protein